MICIHARYVVIDSILSAFHFTIICSIELQCEIKHIEIDIKDKVGYNIGGRLVTVGNLLQLIH